VQTRPPAESEQGSALTLQLPGDPEAKYLYLDHALVAAANAVRVLGAERVLESGVRLERAGRTAALVTLGSLGDETTDAALQRLATIPNFTVPP
jgi:hypothetical protein